MSRMECHITDTDDEPTERPEIDEDDAYEENRQASIDTEAELSRELGAAIIHISRRNSFDKDGLIRILKRAKQFVDDSRYEGTALRPQAD